MPQILDRENWMSCLDKSVRIIDTVIPASHDSSCYPTTDVIQTFENEWVGAVTQLAGYTAQLNTGVRYFDMRVAHHNGDLYMHHSDYYFETFDNVLTQIRNFSNDHPGEYLFLDIDFDLNDTNLDQDILNKILQHIDESKISTAHLHGGVFNPAVTWNDLGDARFLITWAKNDYDGKPWLGFNDYFRESFYDNFNEKAPLDIIKDIANEINNNWQQDKLFVTQAINTPLLSFVTHPGELDANAQSTLNGWIYANTNPFFYQTNPVFEAMYPKLNKGFNIVMRDFVNAGYNRFIIDALINKNKFTSQPVINLGDQINCLDTVRFRTEHGQYLSLGSDNFATLIDQPDNSCNFLLRDYNFKKDEYLPYSGNMDQDHLADQGNFRMVPNSDGQAAYRSGDDTNVLTINSPDNKHRLMYPMSWGDSQDQESFMCYDPDDTTNNGMMYNGSRVVIKSLIGEATNWFQSLIQEVENIVIKMIPFMGSAFSAAINGDPGRHPFLMATYDQSNDGQVGVYVASPGFEYATTFIIEKV